MGGRVAVADALQEQGMVVAGNGSASYVVTDDGANTLAELGIKARSGEVADRFEIEVLRGEFTDAANPLGCP